MLAGIFAAAVVVSASRAAVGAMLLLTLSLGLVWLRRSRLPLAVLVLALAAGSSVAYSTRLAVVQKQERFEQTDNALNSRDLIWNGAFIVWKEFPVFGIGMDNYSRIDAQKIRDLVEASGKPFDASKYFMIAHAHAHSLYVHTLVERGIFGLAVVLAVLLMWIYWLMRFFPKKDDQDIAWALWGGSFSAWIITVVVGFVNTTLHHEHAILSVLLLGMWLAFLQEESTIND
jgi:O-antigen ligase